IFLPCDPVPRPIGRVSATVIPPAELATIVHPGPHTHIDRTWVRRSSDHCTKTTQRLPSPNCSRSWPAATKSQTSEPGSIPTSVFTPPPAVSPSLFATKNNSRPRAQRLLALCHP